MNESTNAPRIVRAEPQQAGLVAPLFDAYRQFYGKKPDLPGARDFILERLKANQSVVFLALAESEGSSAAVGFVQLYPAFTSVSMQPLWILNDLYVVPEARKQGVAKSLMEAARQLAVSTKSEELILETAKDNYSAQKLYEQLGYKKDENYYRYALNISG
jgi:ribosomal protein S18 acetylase RimI-like enzyme